MATERIDIVVTERGSRRVRRNLEDIGKGATAAQGAVSLLRRSLGLLGGALIIGNAVRTLADFGQAMSTVRAITESTETEFKSLRDEAKRLGATTRFSATQAAEGMTFLARAGFDANQVMGTIQGTLQLAQAGALDLGRAADIASNVLQGFRLNVDQTNRVVDVLAKAANSSNTNVEQLGDAMKFVAPVAAGMGVSLEEATAAAGALSNAGLQASLAGTGLRRVLSELESPATKTQKILAQLGVSSEEVRVSQVGLTAALKRLREAGVDTGLALEIFGDRGGPAFEVLSSSIPDVERLNTALQNAEGTAARIAETMDDNLNGALFAVKSAFEAVIIAIGDLGAESTLTAAFRGLATALRFVATNIDDVAAAAKIAGAAFLAMKLPLITRQVRALTVAILANPIGLLVGSLTLAISALTVFRDQIKLTEDGTVTLGDAMTAAGDVIGTTLVSAVNSLGGSFENFDELAQRVIEDVSRGFVVLLAAANGALKAIIAAFDDFPRALKEIAVLAWNGFLSVVESSLNFFTAAIRKALAFLGLETEGITFNLDRLRAEGTKGGTVIGTAFREGFNDVIKGTLLEARARREAEAAQAAAGGAGGVPAAPGAPAAPTQRPAGVSTGGASGPTFAELLKDLERENTLLKANRDEREKLAAVLDFESQLKRDLTQTEKAQVEALADQNAKLRVQDQLLDDILGPAEAYKDTVEALEALLAKGAISQEQFNRALRDARIAILDTQTTVGAGFERGFLRAQASMEDFASTSEQLITDAFSKAQDAVVDFFKTGKFEMDDFFRSLADNFLKLGTQQLFAGAFGGGGPLGGLGGILGGGAGGGGLGGLVSGLLGFQSGGSFTVNSGTSAAALTGVDNRLIAFRAQDGEKVTVTPRDAPTPGGGPINQVFNITTPDADSFQRSKTQIQNRALAGLNRARARR